MSFSTVAARSSLWKKESRSLMLPLYHHGHVLKVIELAQGPVTLAREAGGQRVHRSVLERLL